MSATGTFHGQYNDGVRAGMREVRIMVGLSGLTISDAQSSAPVAVWPFQTLRLVDRVRGAARLTAEGSDARLTAPEAMLTPDFLKRVPVLRQQKRQVGRRLARMVSGAALVGGIIAGLWFAWPAAADLIAREIPLEWEQRIGRAIVTQQLAGRSACVQVEGRRVLDALAARLEPHAGYGAPMTVMVADFPQVNAFAAPGGIIVLFRGLIERAQNAEEVAGVLAHEMGHVGARHSMRLLMRHSGWVMVSALLLGDTTLASLGPLALTLSYSREFEADADQRAVATLRAANIDGQGLVSFFERMEREEGARRGAAARGITRYAQTHPAMGERRAALAPIVGRGGPAMSADDWQALRGICGKRLRDPQP
ncbi:MAG: M48 family metallopeptidase [Alphaproteobacteria bacterium]|nr:M48 family metallopeptidase [Alphaproteobacteria bacterium]